MESTESTVSVRRRRRQRILTAGVGSVLLVVGAVVVVSSIVRGDPEARSGTVIDSLTPYVQEPFSTGESEAQTFVYPFGVAAGADGSIFVAETTAHRIRRSVWDEVFGLTATVIAGTGVAGHVDGRYPTAQFDGPCGLAVDSAGNVYVSDSETHRIRKISTTGVVSTVAGAGVSGSRNGTRTSAQFSSPCGLAVDVAGNLYVADTDNHQVRKVTPAGVVTTLAGRGTAGFADGPATVAMFSQPFGVAVDGAGNVYVADRGNNRIRKVAPSGAVTTIAGGDEAAHADGRGAVARFSSPSGVAASSDGTVFVADTGNHRIRMVRSSGEVTTIAGSGEIGARNAFDEPLTNAQFNNPIGIALTRDGRLFVADTFNGRIRSLWFPW